MKNETVAMSLILFRNKSTLGCILMCIKIVQNHMNTGLPINRGDLIHKSEKVLSFPLLRAAPKHTACPYVKATEKATGAITPILKLETSRPARFGTLHRTGALINACSKLETTHLELLRLINPPGSEQWSREIVLKDPLVIPGIKLDDVKNHVAVALRMRPDLNEARLRIQRGNLEIFKTKNGLLPRMDLFITMGKTGYADSFGNSGENISKNYYDVSVSLNFEIPSGNRSAKAHHRRGLLTRGQASDALKNLINLVQVDVRSAYIEMKRAAEQVPATTATLKLQEEKLRAEIGKFRVGKSTSLLVAQTQRDLLESQISKIEATVNYLKALINLYRLEGSLLERRGISAPGQKPPDNYSTY